MTPEDDTTTETPAAPDAAIDPQGAAAPADAAPTEDTAEGGADLTAETHIQGDGVKEKVAAPKKQKPAPSPEVSAADRAAEREALEGRLAEVEGAQIGLWPLDAINLAQDEGMTGEAGDLTFRASRIEATAASEVEALQIWCRKARERIMDLAA